MDDPEPWVEADGEAGEPGLSFEATNTPHDRNRALLTLITAQLASEELEIWGITPPQEPLEQIATYLDHRDAHNPMRRCVVCGTPLTGRQRLYCSPTCNKRAQREPSARTSSTRCRCR